MTRIVTITLAALLFLAPAASHAALSSYNQNFEGLAQADPGALGGNGWKVFGNVFSPDFSAYLYGYGPFPAPNGTGAFCQIASGQGGAPQGAQQLVVYSDYNNGGAHSAGQQVEANVFQEQTIGPESVGSTWLFEFDAKHGDLVSPSTSLAFIKTLNPSAGFATTNFITVNTTPIPTSWGSYTIMLPITAGLVGQILQFGFACTATSFTPSGMFYDNIVFRPDGALPTHATTWGKLKSLYR